MRDAVFSETIRLWHNRMALLLVGALELGSLILLVALAVGMPQARTALLLTLAGAVVLFVVLMSWGARTRIGPTGLEVRGVTVPLPRWKFTADQIASVEAIRIDALNDWGGWGLRWVPRRGSAIIFAGDAGVRLTLPDGTVRVIASRRPDELYASILALGVPETGVLPAEAT